MNNVSSDLMNWWGNGACNFFASIKSSVCFEKSNLAFGCQEVGFLRVHWLQWASLVILLTGMER